MPQAAAASERDDPSNTWAIAKIRQATRLSRLRDASRRSFCADSSSRVTSILRPIMSSVRSCRPAAENLTLKQMGTSKSYKSQEYRRLVLPQFDPGRGVVAGALASALVAVDAARLQARAE